MLYEGVIAFEKGLESTAGLESFRFTWRLHLMQCTGALIVAIALCSQGRPLHVVCVRNRAFIQ